MGLKRTKEKIDRQINKLYKEAYSKGLDRAWEAFKSVIELLSTDEIYSVFLGVADEGYQNLLRLNPNEIIFRIEDYKLQKKWSVDELLPPGFNIKEELKDHCVGCENHGEKCWTCTNREYYKNKKLAFDNKEFVENCVKSCNTCEFIATGTGHCKDCAIRDENHNLIDLKN